MKPQPSRETYIKLWKDALHTGEGVIFEAEKYFMTKITDDERKFIDDLALKTQICIKTSKLMYVHGHVLYLALRNYLQHMHDDPVNILETGTARGFSAVCMAKALSDENRQGVITTYDILSHTQNMKWNCIGDLEQPNGLTNRAEILKPWKSLISNIRFMEADTRKTLGDEVTKDVTRIHFAFLDAHHDYEHLSHELNFTASHQQSGDIIICDDYTKYHRPTKNSGPYQYPGIIKAVDEFISKRPYNHKIFYADDGTKLRGYVYLIRR